MFTPPVDKTSTKYSLFALIGKRNKQFSKVFKRLRDPVTIIEGYLAVQKVYQKYFGDEDKAHDWVKILLYAYPRSHFFIDEIEKEFGFKKPELNNLFKRIGKRHLLDVEKSGTTNIYRISAEGYLFISKFTKECASVFLGLVKEKKPIRPRPKIK